MENKTLSIGIILFNNPKEEIFTVLDSILNQTYITAINEILIRDQSRNCLKFVNEWLSTKNPEILIKTYSGDNIGFGAGHNFMFNKISKKSTLYLCLNPDGFLRPTCIENLIKLSVTKNHLAVIDATQEPIKHQKIYDHKTSETPWSDGACLLIPCAIYKKINGFDETFFLYCEDVDISWRAKAAGYKCYTAQNAFFYHDTSDDRSDRTEVLLKSACILAHKWRAKNLILYLLLLYKKIDVDKTAFIRFLNQVSQMKIRDVRKVAPDFSNKLVFAAACNKDR